MKTLGKIIAFAFVFFNSACEPEDTGLTPSVPPSDTHWKSVSIQANLVPEIEDEGDGTMFMHWKGSAFSTRAGKVNITLTHEAYDFDKEQNFSIKDGSFNLWSDDFQHVMVGNYTGRGFETNGQFIMEGYVSIQSGSGKFAHDQASLAFTIARFSPFSPYPAKSEIQIRGKIMVPDIAPVP